MSDLKPCPFCGGEAISFSEDAGWDMRGNNEYRAYAGCCNDACGIGFELYHTGDDLFDEDVDDTPDGITCKALEHKAIEAWNARYERTCEVTYGEHGCPYCGECGARVMGE